MPELLVTGPAAEPLHLQHVKDHVRESGTGQDKVIPVLIGAARQFAETRTARQLVYARYQYQLNEFPQSGCSAPSGPVYIPGNAIRLPRGPVGRVVSVTYLDTASVRQTLTVNTDYVVNTAMLPALITPPFGRVWPVALPQPGSVIVTYDVGHAAAVTFPASGANVTVKGPMVWAVDDVVRFSNSGGALPSEVAAHTDYYVKTVAGTTYTFAASAGGTTITFTGAGSGQSYLGEVPEGILSWMLVRIGTLYENREEVAILSRGKIDPLPYVDGLLDPYMVMLP